jgi:hypothetical protein
MQWAIDDRLLGLTSKMGEAAHRIAVENNGVDSELYFAKSQRHVIDTTDARQIVAQEVTVIYLSFTNVRISITLPGGSVSLRGGTSGKYSRKQSATPFAGRSRQAAVNRNSRAREWPPAQGREAESL